LLYVLPEGVADGGADAGGVENGKVRVVVDEVDARLGTDEEAFKR
jgi:hypothetical protein